MKRIRAILGGIKSYIPFLCSLKGTNRIRSARYCYSVWLRHLAVVFKNGFTSYPRTIAELGPGSSIGVGLAGLISGAEQYYSLDVVEHATNERNREVFLELVTLFRNREDIPGEEEFPRIHPRLESYSLSDIFEEDMLNNALREHRINNIRYNLLNMNSRAKDSFLRYFSPWFDSKIINDECVDMVFSQAVLEHVDDLEHTYKALYRWLKQGGVMSHQIDFKCHGMADEWNGHWAYSDRLWKVIKGNRAYLLNRELLSAHIKHLETSGFKIICIIPVKNNSGLNRDRLASRFRKLSDEDLTTSSAHIISVKA